MAQDTQENRPGTDIQKKGRTKKRKRRHKRSPKGSGHGRGRPSLTPFPPIPIYSALILGEAIQLHASGQQVRRLTLFEKLGKSPESSVSRLMITNSNRYGITEGSYKAEYLSLTELGGKATNPEASKNDKNRALFSLSIEKIPAFSYLYVMCKGNRLPSPEIMRDWLAEIEIEEKNRKKCVEVFLSNAKHLGLLRTIAGAERLLPIEHVLEEGGSVSGPLEELPSLKHKIEEKPGEITKKKNWKKICFFIAPIGKEGEEQRKHSDMMLESLITRALEGEDLEVVRADKISDPGMISAQVIEYILRSALVIADLSFHNPNVFYELAIRHMLGKPTVHVIRKQDPIPFDVKDFRTIEVDTEDKYDLVANLDIYRSEISTQVRLAISGSDTASNPIKASAPNLKVNLD